MDDTHQFTAEALENLCDDLRDIRVACSEATDALRDLLDQIPPGSGCIITIVGVDGEDEVDEDKEDAELWRGVDEFFERQTLP